MFFSEEGFPKFKNQISNFSQIQTSPTHYGLLPTPAPAPTPTQLGAKLALTSISTPTHPQKK